MMPRWLNPFRRKPEKQHYVLDNELEKLPSMNDTVWSESLLYQHSDFEKWNPDDLIGRKGASIYKRMMCDEQVKAVVIFKRGAIISRDYFFDFTPEAKDILSDGEQEFRLNLFNSIVDKIDGCFKDGLSAIMAAQWQGFSMTEVVPKFIEYDGRAWLGIKSLTGKPFDTFRFKTDKYGNVLQIIQELNGDKQTIDPSKVIHFVYNMDMDEHYGMSELRQAYRAWFSKDTAIKFNNIYLERMAGGFVTMSVDPSVPGDPPVVTPGTPTHNAVMETLKSLHTMSGILVPAGFKLEVHSPGSTDAFEKSTVMHDLAIAKALLVPNLLGLSHTGQTGAFAQSQTQLEAFLWTLDHDANRLEDAINEQLFRALGEANFGDEHWPRFSLHPLSEQMKMIIIEKWTALVSGKAVTATDADEAHLRDLLGFPEPGEPLQSAEPPAVPPNPVDQGDAGDDATAPPVPDPDAEDETIMSKAYRRIVLRRAMKRVRVNVIEKNMNRIEEESVDELEGVLAGVAADLFVRVEDQKLGTPAQDAKEFVKFDATPAEKRKVQKVAKKFLNRGWKMGLKHGQREIDTARGERFTRWDMKRLDEDASEFFNSRAFSMSGKLTRDMVAIIRNNLEQGIKFSWTTNDIVKRSYGQMVRRGYLKSQTMQSALGLTQDDIAELLQETVKLHHLRTVVRTATTEAVNEARFAAFDDPSLEGFVEALEYSAILDGATTHICRHMDDRQFGVKDEVWNTYRPPNHFNCRSLLIPITSQDTWERSETPTVEPQAGFGGAL